jgi:hypothetical protein
MVAEGGSAHDRARVVRRYLSALDAQKPGRGAARTAESVQHRIHQVDTLLLSADPVQKLHLTQERIDLHAEFLRLTTGQPDMGELEKAFVRVAKAYGDRHDISYSAWRQIGVDSEVLAQAGIAQTKTARPAPGAAPADVVVAQEPDPAPKKAARPKKAAAKKATNGKAAATKPTAEQQTLPAEAHLLS